VNSNPLDVRSLLEFNLQVALGCGPQSYAGLSQELFACQPSIGTSAFLLENLIPRTHEKRCARLEAGVFD
jgi:hypothetical protein